MAKHLMALDQALTDVAAGRSKRLIVEMPPRHGKSKLTSEAFPAWYLGAFPDRDVILTSATDDLAAGFSMAARDSLIEHGPSLFGVTVRPDVRSRHEWQTTAGGSCRAAGVGGAIMGKGCNCLVAGTMVNTEAGLIDIATLVQLQYRPRVLSFNHATDQFEWRRILATKTSHTKSIVEIKTKRGRTIRATAQHRIFDIQNGYREAGNFNQWSTCLALSRQQDVHGMRQPQGPRWPALQSLLLVGEKSRDAGEVQLLRKGFRQTPLRCAKTQSKRDGRSLLFSAMLAPASRGQELPPLPNLSSADRGKRALLRRMQAATRTATNAVRYSLSRMREAISPAFINNVFLLEDVLRRSAFGANDGHQQFQLQARRITNHRVFRVARDRDAAGRMEVFGLRQAKSATQVDAARSNALAVDSCGSSLERRYARQPHGESGDTLRTVPRETPQVFTEWEADAVSSVTEVGCEAQPVYDLQVEGNSNFFANEILVHNCLIIDDFFKNVEEALSETTREAIGKWFASTSETRLTPDGAVVIVATRWHTDDLIGRCLKEAGQGGEQWTRIRFPALAEKGDPLGRAEGDPLWPERYGRDWMEARKKSYTIRGYEWMWESLYQQNPPATLNSEFSPDYFGDFIWFDSPPPPDQVLWRVMTLDPSLGRSDKSDYSAIVSITLTKDITMYVDADLQRRSASHIVRDAIALGRAFNPHVFGVEANGFQSLLQDTFWNECRAQGVMLNVQGITSTQNKIERIRATLTEYLHRGRFRFRRGSPGAALLVEQLKGFPTAKHDDGPDALEMGVKMLTKLVNQGQWW
jgi:predicted phage terminase large subunit-like protein